MNEDIIYSEGGMITAVFLMSFTVIFWVAFCLILALYCCCRRRKDTRLRHYVVQQRLTTTNIVEKRNRNLMQRSITDDTISISNDELPPTYDEALTFNCAL